MTEPKQRKDCLWLGSTPIDIDWLTVSIIISVKLIDIKKKKTISGMENSTNLDLKFKVNGYTARGEGTVIFISTPFWTGINYYRKELAAYEILSYKIRTFGKGCHQPRKGFSVCKNSSYIHLPYLGFTGSVLCNIRLASESSNSWKSVRLKNLYKRWWGISK